MLPPRTQNDVVKEFLDANEDQIFTEKLRIPGIEVLHLQPFEEIAEILATVVLKAKSGLVDLHWAIGEYIEVSYRGK